MKFFNELCIRTCAYIRAGASGKAASVWPYQLLSQEVILTGNGHLTSLVRGTMLQGRLSNYMVLHVHKQYTDSLDLKEVANVTSYLAVNNRIRIFWLIVRLIWDISRIM